MGSDKFSLSYQSFAQSMLLYSSDMICSFNGSTASPSMCVSFIPDKSIVIYLGSTAISSSDVFSFTSSSSASSTSLGSAFSFPEASSSSDAGFSASDSAVRSFPFFVSSTMYDVSFAVSAVELTSEFTVSLLQPINVRHRAAIHRYCKFFIIDSF